MNVLHLNQSDISGGAAIAAYRLHKGLRGLGIDSRLLVPEAVLSEATTSVLPPMSLAERTFFKLTFKVLPNQTNLLRSWGILKTRDYQIADVINFHNLHTGLYFNYLTIPRITREKPVVFTLHDMWSFTGHCSYSFDCEKWLNGCGHCPYPETYPAVQWDNTALESWLKQKVYARSKLTIVTPSRWLSGMAHRSMLSQFPIHTIPYGIDTGVYRPMDKAQTRAQLGLPHDKVILMFGCADINDPRKGMDILVHLLQSLPDEAKKNIALYAMGRESTSFPEIAGIQVFHAGYVEGDEEKARRYSAADIFISTTRADNLPLVLQESLACGTPMLAFRIGGCEDIVRHELTGFTAAPDDMKGMANSLLELIKNTSLRLRMSMVCRQIAIEEYAIKSIAQQYAVLYESLSLS